MQTIWIDVGNEENWCENGLRTPDPCLGCVEVMRPTGSDSEFSRERERDRERERETDRQRKKEREREKL